MYNSCSKIKILKICPEKFHKNLIEFYCKNVEKSSNESIITAKNFVEKMPDLKLLREVLEANPVHKNELVTFKIILDIYEHFYKKFDGPMYSNLLYEYIPTATVFYSNLSDDDIKYIFESLGSFSYRDIYDSLITKIKAAINKKKKDYMKHLDNLKKMLICFIGNVNENKIYK